MGVQLDEWQILVLWDEEGYEYDVWDTGTKAAMEKEFEQLVIDGGPHVEDSPDPFGFYLIKITKQAQIVKGGLDVKDLGDE